MTYQPFIITREVQFVQYAENVQLCVGVQYLWRVIMTNMMNVREEIIMNVWRYIMNNAGDAHYSNMGLQYKLICFINELPYAYRDTPFPSQY